jgi:hypothetical protein
MRLEETRPFRPIGNWRSAFEQLLGGVRESLFITSPYITADGVDFVRNRLPANFSRNGQFHLVTDLSPRTICQSATDPISIASLSELVTNSTVVHLARLHAKVYVADRSRAIVTSGNLTAGGLFANHEYGIFVRDAEFIAEISDDLCAYSSLGVPLAKDGLRTFCEKATSIQRAYKDAIDTRPKVELLTIQAALDDAEDDLIRHRLAGGAMHTVFERTVLYLLDKQGPMSTAEMHPEIASIHPELCNDAVDRIIDGKSFGKKWKHAVRTAQQHLKERQRIRFLGGRWELI